MKAKNDTPPLKKSTIKKAHDIAKSIKKDKISTSDAQTKRFLLVVIKKKEDKKEDTEWKNFCTIKN